MCAFAQQDGNGDGIDNPGPGEGLRDVFPLGGKHRPDGDAVHCRQFVSRPVCHCVDPPLCRSDAFVRAMFWSWCGQISSTISQRL
jgi:hypothetical protein